MNDTIKKETVILLHGIGHSMLNMAFIARALKKHGYAAINLTYPSLRHNIKTLSQWLSARLKEKGVWEYSATVHFIGHSMGGLVIGAYLQEERGNFPQQKLGRVVMLGTPHGGSEVADALHKSLPYKILFGPAGQELTTFARAHDKIRPFYELGIIAGTQNWMYPLGQVLIKKPNDGCVSIESTKLSGMTDHIAVPALHGTMGWSRNVQSQAIAFLKKGMFDHAA